MPLIPIWNPEACVLRPEILEGTLTETELALSLAAIAQGRARPPYDDPVTFFEATRITRSLQTILENILGRLTHTRADVNPIIVLDVGFGGGKTHALAALLYATRHAQDPRLHSHLKNLPKPIGVRIAALSGEEHGENGIIHREGHEIKTLWGDLSWQLGTYAAHKRLDEEESLPTRQQTREALGEGPVLILLDELPTYMKTIADNQVKLDKTVQFIQRLIISVSEKQDAALVFSIAEDVYRNEAERARRAISEAVRDAMEETRAHIRRKELILVPVQEEDVVHILKRRLFKYINPEKAKETAEAYHQLYNSIATPDRYNRTSYKEEIEEYYPFHPALIHTLYERLATIDRFQRTRGALRLLNRTVRHLWNQREPDAYLIHPYHIDLAEDGITSDLTEGLGEPRLRNAVESDVWRADGYAVAQELDHQYEAHWNAPLVRRTCNSIYLYSLMAGRDGARGIHVDDLTTLCTTPAHPDHFLRLRDTVLQLLFDNFGYIERRGAHYVFVREQTPVRIIDRLSRDIIEDEVTKVIRENLTKLYSGGPAWLHIEPFPSSPSALPDEPYPKVAILNMNIYSTPEASDAGKSVENFIRYRDDQRGRLRYFSNTTFIITAIQERLETLRRCAQRVCAARMVHENPHKYDISRDRKPEVEEYLARQEGNLYDYTRAAFAKITYFENANKIKTRSLESIGYADAKKGGDVIAHYLTEVLHRIVEEPLSPDYVWEYAWPRDSTFISSKSLYEQFHSVPGLIAPITREVFQKTVKRGIEDGQWILKQGDEVYTSKKPPTIVRVDDHAELLTVEEAEKRGLFKDPPPVPQPHPTPGTHRGKQLIGQISIAESRVESLADGLETRMRREKFHLVDEAILRSSCPIINILYVKNLLTRLAPDKEINIDLKSNIRRSRSPQYSLTFGLNKQDVATEEGRSLLDMAWRMKGVETCDIILTLNWPAGSEPEKATRIIRGLGEGAAEPFIASLEAKVSRRP